jgi:hypothetical protein
VLPDIGKRRATEITLPDIARIHHRLREKPSMANYVVAVVGSMFTWAAKHHRVPPLVLLAARRGAANACRSGSPG